MRKRQAISRGFITVGTAEQVDIAPFERSHCLLPAGVAQHVDRQLQGFADQVGILGGQALVVAPSTGDIEGGVIRR
ncbi:hypothetical protein D3C81_2273360 [compost metagenome]